MGGWDSFCQPPEVGRYGPVVLQDAAMCLLSSESDCSSVERRKAPLSSFAMSYFLFLFFLESEFLFSSSSTSKKRTFNNLDRKSLLS